MILFFSKYTSPPPLYSSSLLTCLRLLPSSPNTLYSIYPLLRVSSPPLLLLSYFPFSPPPSACPPLLSLSFFLLVSRDLHSPPPLLSPPVIFFPLFLFPVSCPFLYPSLPTPLPLSSSPPSLATPSSPVSLIFLVFHLPPSSSNGRRKMRRKEKKQ